MRPNWLPERTLPDGSRPFPRGWLTDADLELLAKLDAMCDSMIDNGSGTFTALTDDQVRADELRLNRLYSGRFIELWADAPGLVGVGITQAGDRALERKGR